MSDDLPDAQTTHEISPEELLLATLQAVDKLQTQLSLQSNSLADLKTLLAGLKPGEPFRLRGKRLADGTLECVLGETAVPIRITAASDIAVGAKQIARQKVQQTQDAQPPKG